MLREKESISILNLSANEARNFFLKEESYCSFDLPTYFKFEPLLNEIYKKICGKRISDFYSSGQKPKDFEGVNHKILNNKDGKYSWRPFQLIHPALYVELVCRLTEEDNWKIIIDRFKEFSANKKIQCSSIPIDSRSKRSDRAALINIWWNEIEQKSIELALDFQYIVKTDITDCYGSIYSHSIAWAIHGKSTAKKNREDKKYIGNIIDKALQDMHHGQTNGIPQGSSLMDFIAEIVLGYADKKLSEKLSTLKIAKSDYFILRYRDDYRIFINNPIVGDLITKCLCEVLISLGLKLNPEKTTSSQNIISMSVKPDKLFWIQQKQQHSNVQKHMLIIHEFSRKYPNSGSLIIALQDLYARFPKAIPTKDVMPLISIIVDIAYNSPKLYPDCAAILSFLISQFKSKSKKLGVIKKISMRFEQIPNTGHLQIWLQRISLRFTKKPHFDELLCAKLANQDIIVWNSDWLETPFKEMVDKYAIIDQKLIDKLPEIIEKAEVDLFHVKQGYYE